MFAIDNSHLRRLVLIYYYSSGCLAGETQKFQKYPKTLERILFQNKFGHIVEFI